MTNKEALEYFDKHWRETDIPLEVKDTIMNALVRQVERPVHKETVEGIWGKFTDIECPMCHTVFNETYIDWEYFGYCPDCGQAIDTKTQVEIKANEMEIL